jgi:hypothetical protein
MRTLYNQFVPVRAQSPAVAITTATTSTAVDTGAFNNNARDVTFVYASGTITDGAWAVTLQECDTSGGSYTAVPADRIFGSVSYALTDDNVVQSIGCRPTKRYVQSVITPIGATTGGIFSCVALLSNGGLNPPARS